MINYELAKELKEAGFPQNWKNDFYSKEGLIFRQPTTRLITGNEIFIPTLSELIEACGDEFGSIERRVLEVGIIQNIIVWDCWDSTPLNRGYGSTPEEAVAKLWLELNKK